MLRRLSENVWERKDVRASLWKTNKFKFASCKGSPFAALPSEGLSTCFFTFVSNLPELVSGQVLLIGLYG